MIKITFVAKNQHQWLIPVILATQEAEIRRIGVQSQLGQRVHKTYLEKPFTHTYTHK
jgi:hypothetical protein